MLFTLSHSEIQTDWHSLLSLLNKKEVIFLWQNGVSIGIEKSELLKKILNKTENIYALQEDVEARGLTSYLHPTIIQVNYSGFVLLTERYFPQVAL